MIVVDWLKEEVEAAFWIIVGVAMLAVGLSIGDFFGSIGDRLFGKKEEGPIEPPS